MAEQSGRGSSGGRIVARAFGLPYKIDHGWTQSLPHIRQPFAGSRPLRQE